jgi:hypothetical protein
MSGRILLSRRKIPGTTEILLFIASHRFALGLGKPPRQLDSPVKPENDENGSYPLDR